MAKKYTLKELQAQLKKLEQGSRAWYDVRAAILQLQNDAGTSTPEERPSSEKTTSPKPATGLVSFDYDKMVKQAGFTPTERNVHAMAKRKTTVPTPGFINGGTPAQKAALAKKIANMTITKGMSAADAAKIRQARLWYTGQTEGRHGKTAAVFKSGSVKDQLVRGKKAGTPKGNKPAKPKPPKVVLRDGRADTDVPRHASDLGVGKWMKSGQKPRPRR